MNFLEILNQILNNLFIGMGIGVVLFFIRTLIFLVCRNYSSSFISYISSIFVRYEVDKIQKLGFQAYIYSPIIDGKKITVSDVIASQTIDYKDPLIIEQDHAICASVLNKHIHLMFYKKNDFSVKGYFLEFYSRNSHSGTLKVIDSGDSNDS